LEQKNAQYVVGLTRDSKRTSNDKLAVAEEGFGTVGRYTAEYSGQTGRSQTSLWSVSMSQKSVLAAAGKMQTADRQMARISVRVYP